MAEEMEDLVKQYSDSLPDKIKTIEALWQRLQKKWDLDTFSEFHLKIHELCASSELYGFRKISGLANQLQMCLLLLSRESNMIGEVQKQEINDLLHQIKEAIADCLIITVA